MPQRPSSKTLLVFCALIASAAGAAIYLYWLKSGQNDAEAALRLTLDDSQAVAGRPVDWQADHLQLETSDGPLTVRLGEIASAVLEPDALGNPPGRSEVQWSLGRSSGYVERIAGCRQLPTDGDTVMASCKAELVDLEKLIPETTFAIENRSFEELPEGYYLLQVRRRDRSRLSTQVALEFAEVQVAKLDPGPPPDTTVVPLLDPDHEQTSPALAYWERQYQAVRPLFELDPGNSQRRLRYIECAVETDRLREARGAVEQALRSSPADPKVRYWQAVVHLLRGEPDEARDLLDEVRESVSSTYPAVDLYLGLTCSRADRLSQRCSHFRRYLASGTTGVHLEEINRMVSRLARKQCSGAIAGS